MILNSLQTILLILLRSSTQTRVAQEAYTSNKANNQPKQAVTEQISLVADTQHLSDYHLYWQNTSLLQHANNRNNQISLWSLLKFEYNLAISTLSDLYVDWRTH